MSNFQPLTGTDEHWTTGYDRYTDGTAGTKWLKLCVSNVEPPEVHSSSIYILTKIRFTSFRYKNYGLFYKLHVLLVAWKDVYIYHFYDLLVYYWLAFGNKVAFTADPSALRRLVPPLSQKINRFFGGPIIFKENTLLRTTICSILTSKSS